MHSKRLVFLKIETFIFSVALIGFIVMYYYKFMSKYTLGVMLLMMIGCIFSANSSIQQWYSSKKVIRLNFALAILFYIAAIALLVYCLINGFITL